MKTNYKYILSIAALGLALPCMAQPTVVITPPAPPTVVVSPPTVAVVVPDSYVWDGDEYVGVVGDQYYYLGPDNTWIVCDPPRLHRFEGYERDHPDWHSHMVHNTKYRDMDRARDRDRDHAAPTPMRGQNDHSDHGRDHDHNGPPQ